MSALVDGVRRVAHAPAILLGVWTLTLLVSMPKTAAVISALRIM